MITEDQLRIIRIFHTLPGVVKCESEHKYCFFANKAGGYFTRDSKSFHINYTSIKRGWKNLYVEDWNTTGVLWGQEEDLLEALELLPEAGNDKNAN